MSIATAGSTVTGQRVDAISNFRFDVHVDDVPYATFSEISLPSLSLETLEITEGGQNRYKHKLPVRVDVGTVTLKHGLTSSLHMLRWYAQIIDGDVENATRSVTISLYHVDRTLLMRMTLGRAYPVKWSGPSLQADGNQIAFDQVEFAFHDLSIEA
jgi:phage tail-like protein